MNRGKAKAVARARRLKKVYNITPEEWQKMFTFQKGLCAICLRPAADFKHLHVDHDHSSKLIRGLLCWSCNSLLPNRQELTELFERAIAYLRLPPATVALGEWRLCGKPRKPKPSILGHGQSKN
jgi:hypothetical protein